MALFDWDNQYSVGVALMDNHHQRLFDIINKLHEAVKAGQASDAMGSIIVELLDYTKYHFGEEEKMLQAIGYPQLDMHKGLHKKFIDELEGYKADVDKGMAVFAATKVFNTSLNWLVGHIQTIDTGYTELANNHGYR